MILARSSSEAAPLAAMASCFHLPITLPGALFPFAMASSPGTELAGPDVAYSPPWPPAMGWAAPRRSAPGAFPPAPSCRRPPDSTSSWLVGPSIPYRVVADGPTIEIADGWSVRPPPIDWWRPDQPTAKAVDRGRSNQPSARSCLLG